MATTRHIGFCLLFAGLFLTSCSTAEQDEATSTTSVSDDADTGADTQPGETTNSNPSPVAPLKPFDKAPRTTSNQESKSAYISRVAMSATSIELHGHTTMQLNSTCIASQ